MNYVNSAVDMGMCVSLIFPGLNGIVQLIIQPRMYISSQSENVWVDVGVGVWIIDKKNKCVWILSLGILLIASMAARAL